jgi:hypothetical protein
MKTRTTIFKWIAPATFCLLSAFSHTTSAQQIKTVFLSPNDTTRNKLVLVTPPEHIKTTAFMFLIPGSFQQPNDVLVQSTLPEMAAKKGIMVMIPVFETGITSFAIDDSTQNAFRNMLDYCVKTYHLEGKDFYVGGFSAGGTCAVKYAELAVQHQYPVKPAAVFAIDPPLDYARYYKAARRNLRLMKGIYANPESLYMIDRIEKKMNGTPETALKNYYQLSPYSFDDTTQTAVKLLANTPISIYAEPDIDWWLQNRAFDYSNINSVDGAAMINELHLLHNNTARFVATTNKGYRNPGKTRHPHSWSIMDPAELLAWLDSLK